MYKSLRNRILIYLANLAKLLSYECIYFVLNLAIKGGGRPTRLLPHAKMLLVPIKLFLSAG